MNYTQNLHLPQWEASDRIMMDDFNDAMAKIDAGVAANTAALALKGNCRIEVQTYTGTGTSGPGYQKMYDSQEKYRDWLLSQPPEEILNHCYEYTMREDILMSI